MKHNRKKSKVFTPTVLTLTILSIIPPLQASSLFYRMPRTQVQGSFVTNSNHFLGDIDSLLPVYRSQNNLFFTDFKGRLANDNSWLISPGGGVREIHGNQIFGIYGFADYQQTNPLAHFLVMNPGVEWMSPVAASHGEPKARASSPW